MSISNNRPQCKGPSIFDRATMHDALSLAGVAPPTKPGGFISCPLHSPDKTPSFHLLPPGNVRKTGWYCFGACSTKGTIAEFLIKRGVADDAATAARILEEHLDLRPQEAQPDGGLDLMPLTIVAPERLEWLWRHRIPRGKVTILCGDPGVGKSFASLAIAAAVTHGRPLPDGESTEPSNVILWNAEDGLGDTIRPRAEKCGVDLERCFVVNGKFGLSDIDKLRSAVQDKSAALVIIDPIAALLAGVDSHKDNDIRAALQPLVDMAAHTGAAVLAIMHLRKAEAERALYRVGGSIGFTGLARSVLLCAADPEDGRRAIAPLKSNLAAAPSPVEFRIDTEGTFWWGLPSQELTADHLLRATKNVHGGAVREAEAVLRQLLANGPRAAKDVEAVCKERMLSERSVTRARKNLGVHSERSKGRAGCPKGEYILSLPLVSPPASSLE
jgi:hypothetical protein